jgi:hypothetical protein
MGRRPIFKKGAMSDAERQRRRRKKLRRQRTAEIVKRERWQRRAKNTKNLVPYPPGITRWRKVEIKPGITISQAVTQPLAACWRDLTNEEISALLIQLIRLAIRRGLVPKDPNLDAAIERFDLAQVLKNPNVANAFKGRGGQCQTWSFCCPANSS